MIRERVKSGLERTKAQWKALGRPPVDAEREAAIRADLRNGKAGIIKLSAAHCVGVGTVQRIKAAMAGRGPVGRSRFCGPWRLAHGIGGLPTPARAPPESSVSRLWAMLTRGAGDPWRTCKRPPRHSHYPNWLREPCARSHRPNVGLLSGTLGSAALFIGEKIA
jgi:hypothetical protein